MFPIGGIIRLTDIAAFTGPTQDITHTRRITPIRATVTTHRAEADW